MNNPSPQKLQNKFPQTVKRVGITVADKLLKVCSGTKQKLSSPLTIIFT